jgi:hypothetical protein
MKIIEAEKAAPEIAQQAIEMMRALYEVEGGYGVFRLRAAAVAPPSARNLWFA